MTSKNAAFWQRTLANSVYFFRAHHTEASTHHNASLELCSLYVKWLFTQERGNVHLHMFLFHF